jgi:hypothetical protein
MLPPIKKTPYAVRSFAYATALVLTFALTASGQVAAPGTAPVQPREAAALAASAAPTYANRWEIYGGLSFMNGQAGQNLPKRYNMGGVEVQGTYWLGTPHSDSYFMRHLGVSAEFRGGAGTTPVSPNQYNLNRVVVYQEIGAGGVSWRGPKNRYVAIDYHALGGVTHGVFDNAIKNYPPGNQGVLPPTVGTLGLYSDRTAGWGAAGGSIDFNESPKLAIRLSPDIIFEHFGTETREFFSISLGALYRFGKN